MTLAERRELCAARFRDVSGELDALRDRVRALGAQREQLRGMLSLLHELTQNGDAREPVADERGSDHVDDA